MVGKPVPSKLCWSFVLALAFTLLLPYSVGASTRRALIIGNARYEVSPLANPVNDALDMDAALQRIGYETTLGIDLGADELIATIQDFQQSISRGDSVIFYFAGHGIQLGGENYLIPVNANLRDERDLEFQAVQVSRVARAIEEVGVEQSLIILDACRDNPFLSQSRGGTRGLSLAAARTGSMVVYATAPGQVAFDGDGRNGLFTAALLNHIETPGIEVHDMIREVRAEVASSTGNQQIPFATSSITEPMYLASFAPTTSIQPATPAETFDLAVNTPFTGVSVYLDGTFIGQTPVRQRVPEGAYRVTLRHPDMVTETRSISGQGGTFVPVVIDETQPSLSLRLEPLVEQKQTLLTDYTRRVRRQEWSGRAARIATNTSIVAGMFGAVAAVVTMGLYWDWQELEGAIESSWTQDVDQHRDDLSRNIRLGRAATFASAGVVVTAGITAIVTRIMSRRGTEAIEAELERIDAEIDLARGGL